jgi:hypothetical protein
MSTAPRGMQPKADQAKLLSGHPGGETSHEYKFIENTDAGRVLQTGVETLDQGLYDLNTLILDLSSNFEDRVSQLENRGALAILSNGNQVIDFASAYISNQQPTPPISGIDEAAEIITTIKDGDLWFNTVDNVIMRYEGTYPSGSWKIKGAAYL